MAKTNFWQRPNVLGGLLLIMLGYAGPIIVAILSQATYHLVFNELSLVKVEGYGSIGINAILIIAGLLWLLSPKIKEFWPWKKN